MSQGTEFDPWDDTWPAESSSTPVPSNPSTFNRDHLSRLDDSDDVHPLAGPSGTKDDDEESDISRPTLRRLTSETERQVAELAESSRSGGASQSSGSNRGSLDLLRMTPTEENAEIEVLVHHIKPSESLAGIALLYGIDLPTLRKINKLWASDSVHMRTHLYVPIDACKWNKASETFIRGPGPAQITLVSKTSASRKGKTPIRSRQPSLFTSASDSAMNNGWDDADDWAQSSPARAFMSSTNAVYERNSVDSIRPTMLEMDEEEPEQRIVDVVRMPNSQLRFFPRPQRPPEGRRSLEQDMRRVSLERELHRSSSLRQSGPRIQNDLSTLPPPLQPSPHPDKPSSTKSNFVKIRPNTSSTSLTSSISTTAIADKITSFFSIPPPPPPNQRYATMPTRGTPKTRPKLSMDIGNIGSASSSRRSSAVASPIHADIPLEARLSRSVKANGKTNKKLD